jgi:hypothetical protein
VRVIDAAGRRVRPDERVVREPRAEPADTRRPVWINDVAVRREDVLPVGGDGKSKAKEHVRCCIENLGAARGNRNAVELKAAELAVVAVQDTRVVAERNRVDLLV